MAFEIAIGETLQFTIDDHITPARIDNRDILNLHQLWLEACDASDLPQVDTLEIDALWCAKDLMLVKRVAADNFRYLSYGANISLAAGFDMTGKETASFHSEAGRFFARCYDQCLRERKPLYTTNLATHAALVYAWERLLLPFANASGHPQYVLGYNRPLSFKHELLTQVLDAASDIIIGIGVSANDSERDFSVLTVNQAAATLLGEKPDALIGRKVSDVVPDWWLSRPGRRLISSIRNHEPTQFEWHRTGEGIDTWYRITTNPIENGAVVTMSDITALKTKERELEQLANTDELTGASNRRHFFSIAEAETTRATRYGTPLSLVVLDVDHFKHINDSLGHEAGDRTLVALVELLKDQLRTNDTLGRLGGEEFAVLLPHTTETEACDLCDRLRARIADRRFSAGVRMTCSFGVAERKEKDATFANFLRRTDNALYQSKRQGRDRVTRAE